MNWLQRPGRMALVMVLGLSGSALAAGDTTHLSALEQQAGVLGAKVQMVSDQLNAFMPKVDIGAAPAGARMEVAQSSRDTAAMNVRLGQLEEQMRILNGQVEGLQFQLTQLQTFLERQQQDNDFRFEQLEGSNAGKTKAASQSGGVMLPGGVPQTQIEPQPDVLPDSQSLSAPIDLQSATDLPSVTDLQSATDVPSVTDLPTDGIQLGAPERALGTISASDLDLSRQVDLSGQSSGLNLPSTDLVTSRDAEAQYKAGYDAVRRGDMAFAEDQFRQFVDFFPDHPQAPEAANWLGDTLIQRGEYDEAADVLLKSFQDYSTSTRAPDLLLKLGVALAGAGENDTACRTFGEVQRRFPSQPTSFVKRLQSEMSTARC